MTRGKFVRITTKKAGQVLKDESYSTRASAKLLGIPKSTLQGHLARPTAFDRRISNKGQPCIIDKHSKRRLMAWIDTLDGPFTARTVLVDFFRNKECLDESREPSLRTVQRTLAMLPYVSKSLIRPRTYFTDDQKVRRVEYCRANMRTNWDNAYFADELILGLRGAWPWQPRYFSTKKFPNGPPAIMVDEPVNKHRRKQSGDVQLRVWAAVSVHSWTSLAEYESKQITGQEYRTLINDKLVPILVQDNLLDRAMYVHDRAGAHKALETKELLRDLGITEKLLGPKCWILNPIEQLWGILVTKLYDGGHKCYSTLDDLRAAAHAMWEEVRQEHHGSVKKMIDKLPYNMQRMIDAGGDYIGKT